MRVIQPTACARAAMRLAEDFSTASRLAPAHDAAEVRRPDCASTGHDPQPAGMAG